MMRINVHAGHNPDGMTAAGAVGLLKESTEARRVKDKVVAMLTQQGNTVYDCTVNDGTSQRDVLQKIVAKCNAHQVDLDVSIHFNSGRNDYVGDGSVGGTEVFVYDTASGALAYAQRTVRAIAELGYGIRNDGNKDDVKVNPSLYVLKNTNAPAMLVECCFVDDADDVALYNADKMAAAIVKGITGGSSVKDTPARQATPVTDRRKSNEEIAEEVRDGKWGNGQERKNRLTDAGYNYFEIQELVNAKEKGRTNGGTSGTEYYPAYKGSSGSIVTAFNAIGVNSSYENRKNIAARNNIADYRGTEEQNIYMLKLLKNGRLIR